ncbi:MAG: nitroreductase family protein [Desulfobacterales bacterium]|jgi:nitroreductase/NAD-dependent dihydropyrimidine dehydrogenase PreA subunit
MSLLQIDREHCHRDGICADACPARVITLEEDHGYPTLVEDGAERCISCGHCVAVCPQGALNHAAMASQDCPTIEVKHLPDAHQVELFLRARRSIRRYEKAPLSRETLARIIDVARYAPSGHNRQPVRWMVVASPAEVHHLAGFVADWMRHLIAEKSPLAEAMHMDKVVAAWEEGHDRICRDAPHLVLAHGAEADPTAPTAATIALTYLELAAASMDLGACWAGYFNAAANFWPPLKAALKLPEGHVPLGAMMVGRSKYRYQRLPRRNEPQIIWR